MRKFLLASLIAGLLLDATSGLGQQIPAFTRIKVTTHIWSENKGYSALPEVRVLISRGKGIEKTVTTDKNGEASVEMPAGQPITLQFFMAGYVPECQSLATAGAPHAVGVAMLTPQEHREQEKKNPSLTPAFVKFQQAISQVRDVPGQDKPYEGLKSTREILEALKKEAAMIEPRSKSQGSRPPGAVLPLPRDEQVAVQQALAKCLALIRDCQLTNGPGKGAFAMTGLGNGAEPWVKPDHSLVGVLALLAVNADLEPAVKNADLDRVRAWFDWYAVHTNDTLGVSPSFKGMKAALAQPWTLVAERDFAKAYDAVDCTAARHLLAVARYHRLRALDPVRDRDLIISAFHSLQTLQSLTQRDGQTMARPDEPGKAVANGDSRRMLRNNAEYYAALAEGGDFFAQINREVVAARLWIDADRLAVTMLDSVKDRHIAQWVFDTGAAAPVSPDLSQAQANLYGLMVLGGEFPSRFPKEQQSKLWEITNRDFQADGVPPAKPLPLAPLEDWLRAAQALKARGLLDENDVSDWRRKVITQAGTFNQNTYIQRLGGVVLALTDGPARLPEALVPKE